MPIVSALAAARCIVEESREYALAQASRTSGVNASPSPGLQSPQQRRTHGGVVFWVHPVARVTAP
jgi:hypothetical protein